MIPLIIKSYFLLLMSIACGALFLFAAGLYIILKKNPPAKKIKNNLVINDFSAISGDDVVATQLDLARAYLETGKISQAAEILKDVSKQGSAAQRMEAQELMKL